VRVQVITNSGALSGEKQIAVVAEFTEVIVAAAGNPPSPERIWVVLSEAPKGGWGLWGHAQTFTELGHVKPFVQQEIDVSWVW
jgi:phenylpyruvate tautomerase PptA (4-oxalocrotonate tautomerase family)